METWEDIIKRVMEMRARVVGFPELLESVQLPILDKRVFVAGRSL